MDGEIDRDAHGERRNSPRPATDKVTGAGREPDAEECEDEGLDAQNMQRGDQRRLDDLLVVRVAIAAGGFQGAAGDAGAAYRCIRCAIGEQP